MGDREGRRGLGPALARIGSRLRALLPRRGFFLWDLFISDTGRRGEAAAARHLRQRGLRIIGRNLRARSGEIDILALDGSTLVFVEVKASVRLESDPLGRITPTKARRLRRAAALYRRKAGAAVESCRLDGVVVRFRRGRWARMVPEVRWYPAIYPLDDV